MTQNFKKCKISEVFRVFLQLLLSRHSASLWAVRLGAVTGVLLSVLGLMGCGDRQVEAREELHERKYAFTVEDFQRAAREDDVAAMAFFLKAGMRPDVKDRSGNTALLAASGSGRPRAARWLVEAGAQPDRPGAEKVTPLVAAARAGSVETVKLLLEKGADPAARDEKHFSALTAAAFAGHSEVIRVLAPRCKGDLDEALQVAALEGRTAAVDALLAGGASVLSTSRERRTPLMYAAARGHVPVARLLLHNGANRFSMDRNDLTALDLAREAGQIEMVELLSLGEGEPAPPRGRVTVDEGAGPPGTAGAGRSNVPASTGARPENGTGGRSGRSVRTSGTPASS